MAWSVIKQQHLVHLGSHREWNNLFVAWQLQCRINRELIILGICRCPAVSGVVVCENIHWVMHSTVVMLYYTNRTAVIDWLIGEITSAAGAQKTNQYSVYVGRFGAVSVDSLYSFPPPLRQVSRCSELISWTLFISFFPLIWFVIH